MKVVVCVKTSTGAPVSAADACVGATVLPPLDAHAVASVIPPLIELLRSRRAPRNTTS
jgi:hypothetical protein